MSADQWKRRVRLFLTGEFVTQRRLGAVLDTEMKAVQPSPYELLQELVTARYDRKSGYFFPIDSVKGPYEEGPLRMTVMRLRESLGKATITTFNGALRLNVPPEQIEVAPAVYDLPPNIVDARVSSALRKAIDEWHGRDGRWA